MSTLTIDDPTAYLDLATDSDALGQMIDEAKGNLGPIVQAIDWVVEKVLGFSPVEKLSEPLIGDFNAVDEMRSNWKQAGTALGVVGSNYHAMAAAVPATWRGDDAREAARRMRRLGNAHTRQGTAAGLMSRQLGNMLEATSKVVEGVFGLIGLAEDIILSMSAAKIAKEILTGGGMIRKAIGYVKEAIKLIETLGKVIPAVLEACGIMATVMSGVNAVLAFGVAGAQGEAGGHVDSTADAGF
ncbi:hypothetical protein [Phycicoccus sonneratiae]|uniref:WXG100 family type VII secretion target n=1 Tax=Phycicoccus sonneratiae TaxID=2807628 RepID=A0ABS2CH21_9MICO|nr:hypothetical protein [Phycicoccus sonneraticus]MBM6399173.1 hypothetical protein [Phycicoccus sonneraticus]